MRSLLAAVLLAAAAPAVSAQTEDALRVYFEGKTVRVKLEMPGTSQGVEVYPGTSMPVDFPQHAGRLKRFGTAYRRGDEALVTKVKLKDDHIEFQLGGGGYGTFGDDDSPYVSFSPAPKTEREKNLERDLAKTTDAAQKRTMREELDRLRKSREREDTRNRAEAAQAQQIKEANIRQRRIEGGSRFNIRYRGGIPADALTTESVMRALGEYLEFGMVSDGGGPAPGGVNELRKGLTVEQVDAMLGRPETIAQRMEGTLSVSTSHYRTRDRRITAEFVEGVLIRYTITSP